ncbi:MAG: acylphosphatase [Gammaproteobacteria bacterium]|nr:MAG: acylphosphatase [Gammaproteobacteria bacterium]
MHCLVSGRVQGVFYRTTAQRKALQLGLTGWVRNMSDGTVELVACGDPVVLNEFRDWLWQGPAAAVVNAVQCDVVNDCDFNGFDVRY